MSGYNYKYKMSNNAVEAYNIGTKPYNEWSASEIINAVKRLYDPNIHSFDIDKLSKIPLKALRMCTLSYSSWHHTTKKYIETDFYFVDNKKLINLSNADIDKYATYVRNEML